MTPITVPSSKYAHLCRGYLSVHDEKLIRERLGSSFGVRLEQLRIIGEAYHSTNKDMEYLLLAVPVPSRFSQTTLPLMKIDGFGAQFLTALQLCALSGIDLIRFSDAGADIPGVGKARVGTDDDVEPSSDDDDDDDDDDDGEDALTGEDAPITETGPVPVPTPVF